MSTQETIFDRAYYWIDEKTKRAGRWLDKNIGRILFATGAAGISAYGYQQSDGTFLNSISPELFGIVLTAVIIDYVNERRQEAERKKVLIAQLGSERRDVTELSIIELRNREWLYDGSLSEAILFVANLSGARLWDANLRKADLRHANLSGALLARANLSGASLWDANLSEASLIEANLSGADLIEANLTGAEMLDANLSGAKLYDANLSRASLGNVNLSGADLWGANMSGANLSQVNLDGAGLWEVNLSGAKNWNIEQLEQTESFEGTIMPDGVQLGQVQDEDEGQDHIEGPTFEEWKAQYLAKHGGTVTDWRNVDDPDDSN